MNPLPFGGNVEQSNEFQVELACFERGSPCCGVVLHPRKSAMRARIFHNLQAVEVSPYQFSATAAEAAGRGETGNREGMKHGVFVPLQGMPRSTNGVGVARRHSPAQETAPTTPKLWPKTKDAVRILFLHGREDWARHFPRDFLSTRWRSTGGFSLRFKPVMRNYVCAASYCERGRGPPQLPRGSRLLHHDDDDDDDDNRDPTVTMAVARLNTC